LPSSVALVQHCFAGTIFKQVYTVAYFDMLGLVSWKASLLSVRTNCSKHPKWVTRV